MPRRLEIPKMYKLYIGGKFTRTESERYLSARDKRTGEKICNYSRASRKDIRSSVVSARSALSGWAGKTAYERGQILYRLAEMLEGRKEQFAAEIAVSTALSKAKSANEVTKCIDRIVWYAGFSDKWAQLIGTVNSVQSGFFNFSIPEPTGVVGVILPDEPALLALISRTLPIIVSGNTCIVIGSDTSPLPALSFAEVLATSDIPGGVVNILTGLRKELIPHLAGHMDVNSIDYSDSDPVARKTIKELCANNVKRFINSFPKSKNGFFDDQANESLYQIQNFTELKTIWHTMGL